MLSGDPASHAVNSQWLLGWSLLVSPVLTEGAAEVTAYFPAGNWYPLDQLVNATSLLLPSAGAATAGAANGSANGSANTSLMFSFELAANGTNSTTSSGDNTTSGGSNTANSTSSSSSSSSSRSALGAPGLFSLTAANITVAGPATVKLPAPLGAIPLHIRGGGVVPIQRVANTTSRVRTSPVTLFLALQRPAPAPATLPSGAAGRAAPPHNEGVPPYCVERAAQRRQNFTGFGVNSTGVNSPSNSNGSAAGQLLTACGILYMDDGESVEVTGPGSALIWLTSLAAADGSAGDLTAEVSRPPAVARPAGGRAAARDTTAGVVYEEVVVVGLPASGAGGNSSNSSSTGSSTGLVGDVSSINGTDPGNGTAAANATAGNSTLLNATATANGTLLPPTGSSSTSGGNATAVIYTVSVGSGGAPPAAVPQGNVVWDGARGVLRVTGLKLPVGAAIQLRWQRVPQG